MKTIFAALVLSFAFFLVSCSSAPGGTGSSSRSNSSSSAAPLTSQPGIYVTTNGNDSYIGTNAATAMLTIQLAISNAKANGWTNIFVAQGVYTPGAGLRTSGIGIMISNFSDLFIYGGFSSDFSNRTGKSELDATNGLDHVVSVSNSKNILIDGFIVKNGKSVTGNGGGFYISGMTNGMITNTLISNNYAHIWGGGIYMENSWSNAIIIDSVRNMTRGYGAGAHIRSSSWTAIGGNITENSATNDSGGGVFVSLCQNLLITANFYNNSSSNLTGVCGGALMIDYCTNVSITGSIFTNNWAKGPYPYDNSVVSLFSFLDGVIISNCTIAGSANKNGNGIYAFTEGGPLTGHIIKDNIFISNDLDYLYCNHDSTTIPRTATWTNINATIYTDAAIASGNILIAQ